MSVRTPSGSSTSSHKTGNLKKGHTTDGTPNLKPTMAQAASNVYRVFAENFEILFKLLFFLKNKHSFRQGWLKQWMSERIV